MMTTFAKGHFASARYVTRVAAAVLCLGAWGSRDAVRAGDLPTEIRDALERNARALSPVTVSWTEQLGSSLPLQQWLKKVKCEPFETHVFKPVEVSYSWQDGMSYSLRKSLCTVIGDAAFIGKDGIAHAKPGVNFDGLPMNLDEAERACNGKDVFCGQGREGYVRDRTPASLVIDSVDAPKSYEPNMLLFDPTYFREAGFVLPRTVATLRDGAKSLPLHLMSQGYRLKGLGNVMVDGEPCVRVELVGSSSTDIFHLRKSCAYAVSRREELSASGRVTTVSTASEFVRFGDPEIWLPKRCDVLYYTWNTIPGEITDKPLARRTFIVRSVDKGRVPLQRFTLNYRMPFTRIADSTLPQSKHAPKGVLQYMVPPNPADVDAAIEAAAKRRTYVPSGLRYNNLLRFGLVGAGLLAFAVGIGIVVKRLLRAGRV